MPQAGAVGAIVAGAMLLVMVTQQQPLEQLKTVLTAPPSTWAASAGSLPWTARLFGIASVTVIMAFFSAEVATGFSVLAIAYWIVHRQTATAPAAATGIGASPY